MKHQRLAHVIAVINQSRADQAWKIARRMKSEGLGWEDIFVTLRRQHLDVIAPAMIKAFVLGGCRS